MGNLAGWPYWKVISLTGQAGAGTDYQVKFEIGDSAGGGFHLEGHCTNFPQDIRITDDDGTTLLDHWVEDLTADPIVVHVKVNDDLGSNQDVRVYYGKNGETSASNIKTTFINGDDFEDSSLDAQWTYAEGATPATDDYSESSGVLQITSAVNDHFWTSPYLGNVPRLYVSPTGLSNFEVIVKVTTGTFNANYKGVGLFAAQDNDDFVFIYHAYDLPQYGANTAARRKFDAGVSSVTNINFGSKPNPTYLKLVKNGSTIDYYESANGVSWTDLGSYTKAFTVNQIGITTFDSAIEDFDDFRVRKYNSPEPAFSSAGAEQSPTGVSPTGVFYGPLVGRIRSKK
jgi:hypothetical protein